MSEIIDESRRGATVGDRIIQIVLLLIIAGGIFMIVQTLGGGASGDQGVPAGAPSDVSMGGPMSRPMQPGSGVPGGTAAASDNASGIARVAVESWTVTPGTVKESIKLNGEVLAGRSVSMYPDAAGEVVELTVAVGQFVAVDHQLAVVDPSQPGQRYSTSPALSAIAGTVTAVHVEIGDTVTQQTAIATVGDLSNLEVVTWVPERYIASIATGLVAEITLEAFPDEVFRARVTELSPIVDGTSRTVEVGLAFERRDPRVKAGMFATMSLITREERDVLAVPTRAVTSYYNEEVVYVVSTDGTVERRPVTTGLRSSDLVQITSGIVAGEAVVTAGIGNVTDGTQVRVVSTGGEG